MTASKQWPILELFRALGRHRRRLSQARAPRLLREPCLGVTLDAGSRTGSPGTCCAPLGRGARRQRRGRGPIVGRPASRDSGDRRAAAIDLDRHPGRAGRCSRSAGAPGRAVSRWDRPSLDRAYRTYPLARPAHQPAPTPTSPVGLPRPGCLPTDGPAPPFGPTTHRRDCPPPRPICGPDSPTALRHRARRPSARYPPARPADPPPDPATVGSRDQGPGHPVGRSGDRAWESGCRPRRSHRPTTQPAPAPALALACRFIGSGSGSGLSIHRLRLRLWPVDSSAPTLHHRPTIPTGSRPAAASAHGPPIPARQHRPTIPTGPRIGPRRLHAAASAHDPHRLTARGSIGPRGSIAHDPHAAASAHDPHRPIGPRGSIGPRSPRPTAPRGSIGPRSPRGPASAHDPHRGASAHGPRDQHRPTIPIPARSIGPRSPPAHDPHAAASAHDPHRSPRGSIGPRPADPRAAAQHRPTARRSPRVSIGPRPADPRASASAHGLPIPARQHRPTACRSPRVSIGPRPADPRASASAHGPPIPARQHRPTARRSPRVSIGPPARPTQHRSADPRASASAHGPDAYRPTDPPPTGPTAYLPGPSASPTYPPPCATGLAAHRPDPLTHHLIRRP